MKVVKQIKKLKRFFRLAAAIVLLGVVLNSCIDEHILSVGESDIPEGMEKISFYIPDYNDGAAKFGTKALPVSEEGYMSNLYIVAVKYEEYTYDNNGNITDKKIYDPGVVYTYALNPVGIKFKVNEKDYHQFNVALYPGKYKFGVIANCDLYLSRAVKILEFTKEEDLENIILNFTEDTPLVPTHLPMACLPWNIQYQGKNDTEKKPTVESNNYLIEITRDNATQIFADMTFLCSKVRYTILFDKTENGISKDFGSAWIRFNVDDQNKPQATNLRKQTKLVPSSEATPDMESPYILRMGDDSMNGWWNLTIERYKWHLSDGANYPTMPQYPEGKDLEEWDGSLDDWINSEQKVWQGVVYLPENDEKGAPYAKDSEGNDVNYVNTLLKFPYHVRANSLDDTQEKEAPNPKLIWLFGNDSEYKYEGIDDEGKYPDPSNHSGKFTGLERNYFYDVVAKVINPDIDQMSVQVFVSILPWHEIDQNIGSDSNTEFKPSDSESEKESDSETVNSVKDWQYNGMNSNW